MQLVLIVVFLFVSVGTSLARLSKDEMRQALSGDPLFSHQRERAVPFGQNVNVELPMNDPSVQPRRDPRPSARPMMGGQTSGMGVPVRQNRRVQAVPAGKPVRQQEMVLGRVKPTRVSDPQPSPVPTRQEARTQPTRTVNDRMLNNVRPSASMATVEQQAAVSKQECSFHIPSFLLPDPNPGNIGSSLKCPSFLLPGPNINPELVNLMVEHWTGISKPGSTTLNAVKSQITQVEFEQKCLIPALRTHVLGGPACKTRELKVYLEWLLYLRQRLFNI